jgi:hypothetical protein
MNERLRRAIHEAEQGDLRPQFNPNAAVTWQPLPGELKEIEPVLIDRFLDLARPIANSSLGAGPEARLQDAGHFFYLVETLKRLGFARLEETLCVLLDEFAQLNERSYDELYLWCLVELSRTDSKYVDTYWPQVLSLDARYRCEPWVRPAGVPLVEQPYRFTDLLFYYYALHTITPHTAMTAQPGVVRVESPSLSSRLIRVLPNLNDEHVEIARRALEELNTADRRPVFGDALGLLNRLRPRATPAP